MNTTELSEADIIKITLLSHSASLTAHVAALNMHLKNTTDKSEKKMIIIIMESIKECIDTILEG